jgi:hypothetical protein
MMDKTGEIGSTPNGGGRKHSDGDKRRKPTAVYPREVPAAMAWRDGGTRAREQMFAATDRPPAPWTVALASGKRPARRSIASQVLSTVDYAGKDESVIRRSDELIFGGREVIGSK